MDLFHQLGFVKSGLINPGENATQLPEPNKDKKPSLIPGETPAEELVQAFFDAKKTFMAQIEKLVFACT